jgi:uncharacterized protein involved in exopolysaccharide biosynthesis
MRPGDDPIDDGLDLAAIWRVLWGYKFLIVGTSLVFGLVAVYLALTATEMFRAEVIVTEARDGTMGSSGGLSSQLGGLAGLAGINLGGLAGANNESRAVLHSRRLVEEFVKRNDVLSKLYVPPRQPRSLWHGVQDFRKDVLDIAEDTRNNVTTIAIEWPDPAIAAQWANDFVGLCNELQRTRALEESNKNIAYLNDQIAKTTVVELQRVMYSLIESETKKQMLANAKTEYAFTVVDPAVAPEARVSPRRTIMVLFGLALGGFVGVIAAFVHNLIRPKAAYKRPEGRPTEVSAG